MQACLYIALLAGVALADAPATDSVAFYLVKGGGADLELAVPEDAPFLTDQDIIAYDWATHTMSITTEAVSRFPVAKRVPLNHQPFLVVANGKRCYVGVFVCLWSSVGTYDPLIYAGGYDPRAIHIGRGFTSNTDERGDRHDVPDRRENADLHAALAALGKLTDGIPGAEEYAHRCEIEFVIHREQRVRVAVARSGGSTRTVIEDRVFAPGKHVVTWNGSLADEARARSGAYAAEGLATIVAESGRYYLSAFGDDIDQMKYVEYTVPTGEPSH